MIPTRTGRHEGIALNDQFVVVIPAYNEADTIVELIQRASRYAHVCVIDDCSTDDTASLVESTGKAHLIRHEKNTHIAGGIIDGMKYAIDAGYSHCITIDAGLSHDPDAIPLFQHHQDADLVLSYRVEKVNIPFYRQAISYGARLLMNLALEPRFVPWGGAGFKDVTSGYRMYSRNACKLLTNAKMGCRSFDFHIEALAYIFRAGMVIEEVPIRYEFTNSSLKPEIVTEALRTCWRIWTSQLE